MIISKWHTWLGMRKNDRAWHEQDIAEEFAEYKEAKGLVHRWSELSDIVYTCTRAQWSGHDLTFPLSRPLFWLGAVYMLPKYTSRSLFFRRIGNVFNVQIREVRNPKKDHKLKALADHYGVSEQSFVDACKKQKRFWPLLP